MVHNYVGSSAPSGENVVYEVERGLLEANGHQVRALTRNSDEVRDRGLWRTVKGGLATAWNPWMRSAMRVAAGDFQPNLVYVINTFPLISPSIYGAIDRGIPRVLMLQNYRLFCPAGVPMREGRACTDCLDKHSVFPSLFHGCYWGSRVATMPIAMNVALHRFLGTWTTAVDAFIVPSGFQREKMVAAGLPAQRVHVKPNFYAGNPSPILWKERAKCVVFAGRLSREKGVEALMRAWRQWGAGAPELRVAGDGPLRARLVELARGLPVRFLGQLGGSEAQAEIAQARMVIVPSQWFEGFPMVLHEAFAHGTPAAVSNIGPLPSIVAHGRTGVVFEPGNPGSIVEAVRTVWENPERLESMGIAAREEFEQHYTREANYRILMDVFERAEASAAERVREAVIG